MATWLVVWFVIAIVSTVVVIAFIVALVRHVLVLGRAARQMQEAVTPLADEIAREGQRASGRAVSLEPPGPPGSRR